MSVKPSIRLPQIGDVYIYLDRPMLALPLSLTILRVNKVLPDLGKELHYNHKYYLSGSLGARACLNRLAPRIDHLEKEEYITSQHSFIYPSELNQYGIYPYLRDRLERELANFFWKHKLRPADTKCYRVSEFVKSFYYYNERVSSHSIGLKLGFFLGWIKRRGLIESVWHPLNPEYDWLTNNGAMVWPHIKVCLSKGIEPRYHIFENLKKLPYHWYREVLKGNVEEIYLNNYYRDPPLWWRSLVGRHFFCYLSNNQLDKILPIIEGSMPREFAVHFMDVYPPKLDIAWDDPKSIIRKRLSYENYLKKHVYPRKYD